MGQRDMVLEGLDPLLLALKMEKGSHKPKNAMVSRSCVSTQFTASEKTETSVPQSQGTGFC